MDTETKTTAIELPTRRKFILAISAESLAVIDAFHALDTKEKIVTKADLWAIVGRNPMGYVETAKRHLLRDYGMVIEWDRTAGGWRNMMGADNLLRRKDGIGGLRRKARREGEKLSVIDFAKLTDGQKLESCAVASICGAVACLSTTPSIRRIEGAIEKATAAGLPIGKTLALFHENGNK